MAAARELVIADEPAAWEALGFEVGEDGAFALGALRVRLAGRGAGRGVVAVRVEGLVGESPDGLPIVGSNGASTAETPCVATSSPTASSPTASSPSASSPTASSPTASSPPSASSPTASAHPNGALAIDHLVAFTDDADRTAAALAAGGGSLRRRGGPPELPAPMAFVRFGPLIVEVAQAGGPTRFWGLTVTVADLDALAGPQLGTIRPAVQPGRRIATVGRAAGLAVALAFMSQDSNPAARPRGSTNADTSGTVDGR